ncbi:MAG TPA: glycoside hydrolase family 3 protein [Chloroflexia bacterium]|nr:glycoside hydrolase family 3 protein [Chloroflexia bacterium]
MLAHRTSPVPLTLEQAVAQKMLLAFDGHEPPAAFLSLLRRRHVGGVTLFRAPNVRGPEQVRKLTSALQLAASDSGQPPLLVCADQEGGTLLALAGTTPFPGNMALGAACSPELARRTGYAVGRELAALGINVNYAPVCDVIVSSDTAMVGPRSFGEDPGEVGRLAGAMVAGLQQAGVAATAKHFPGHGDTSVDSHYGTPVVPHGEERLRMVELPPFAAAIEAGAKLVMTAHIALPALTGGLEVPATLSSEVLRGLLRRELAFRGLIVTDAMNMGAIQQGQGLVIDAIASVAAGADLLLLADSGESQEGVYAGVLQAARRGLLSQEEILASARRVLDLKAWVGSHEQPGLEVVRCEEHLALAYEVGAKSVTLVRDRDGILPLQLPAGATVVAVAPRPADLTPADTSSFETPSLAAALRRYHPAVEEVVVPLDPSAEDIAALRGRMAGCELAVVGTINAGDHAGQAALVNALLEDGTRVLAVALRLPYDLAAYPSVPAYACTYSLQPPSLQALADALWGRIPFVGRLPVSVEGA